MKYSWPELDRLIEILEHEVKGEKIDQDEVSMLLDTLDALCPDIVNTLSIVRARVVERCFLAVGEKRLSLT